MSLSQTINKATARQWWVFWLVGYPPELKNLSKLVKSKKMQ